MSLALPAIATQIVRKRLIREWFRHIYGLWGADRLPAPSAPDCSVRCTGR